MYFLPIAILFLGALVGSFLNVVILRMNTGRSVVHGRSRCARCDRTLSWYELIPVLSFIGLRGKCRTCKASVSFQYPFVELLTMITIGTLYATVVVRSGFMTFSWISFLFASVVACVLIVLVVYDIRHKILPNMLVYLLIALGLVSLVYKAILFSDFSILSYLYGALALATPFFLLWFFSQGRAMGFGDVKLAVALGLLIGFPQVISVFLFSFWIGAFVCLILLSFSKKYGLKSEVPFAPFMILGFALVSLFGVSLNSLLPLWI